MHDLTHCLESPLNMIHYSCEIKILLFKIIHRAFPCNYTLYKMKLTQTDYCRFCYNVPEILMHMFWECPYVQKLWKTTWDLVFIFTAENIDKKMCNIILCTYNKENQIYTLIYPIVKAYISACKYADKIHDLVECWHKIEYYQETERLIYAKKIKNKLHKYTAKWNPSL